MSRVAISLAVAALAVSADEKLSCQKPTTKISLLHSFDVSGDMHAFINECILGGSLASFEDWMSAVFEKKVTSALDVFTNKNAFFGGDATCWTTLSGLVDAPILPAVQGMPLSAVNPPKRSVTDALYHAAKSEWSGINEFRRVVMMYVGGEASLPPSGQPIFDGSTDCEAVDYPDVGQVKQALNDNHVAVIFIVPRHLVEYYSVLFDTKYVIVRSNDPQDMFASFQNAINALYCNDDIIYPDSSTPIPFTTRGPSCTEDVIGQIMHIQDISWSYTKDLQTLRNKMPEIMQKLTDNFGTLETGVTSFSDKQTAPFGYGGDYCYREDSPLSVDLSAFSQSIDALQILSGRDWKESQYDALIETILSDSLGWNPNNEVDGKKVLRIAIVATDAGPHVGGDSDLPAFTESGNCETRDYPTPQKLGEMLNLRKVFPVFIVTSDIDDYWKGKVASIPTMYSPRVVKLGADKEAIVQVILDIVEEICDEYSRMA